MTRRTALMIAFAALVAVPAQAQDALPLVTPPADWKLDEVHGEVVARDAAQPFVGSGGARGVAYHPPVRGGALVAYALEIQTEKIDAMVRYRLNELRDTPTTEASVEGGSKRTLDWSEKADPSQKLVEARLTWADDSDEVISISRVVWVRPPARGGMSVLKEYRAECVLSLDAEATLGPACRQALETLVFEPIGERETIGIGQVVVDADDGEDGAAVATAAGTAAATAADPAAITTIKPSDVPPPKPKQSGRDWRPFWVIGGLIVVGAAIWLARKRKQETLAALEREEAERKEQAAAEKVEAKQEETSADE